MIRLMNWAASRGAKNSRRIESNRTFPFHAPTKPKRNFLNFWHTRKHSQFPYKPNWHVILSHPGQAGGRCHTDLTCMSFLFGLGNCIVKKTSKGDFGKRCQWQLCNTCNSSWWAVAAFLLSKDGLSTDAIKLAINLYSYHSTMKKKDKLSIVPLPSCCCPSRPLYLLSLGSWLLGKGWTLSKMI